MKKKLLAFLLVLCLILALIPASVFAASDDESVYKLVDSLTDGKEYLIVSSNATGSAYALTNPGGSSSGASMGSTGVSIQSGDVDGDGAADIYISTDAANIVWKATANGSRFNLTNGNDYLEGKSGNVSIFSTQQYADRGWTYSDSQLKHTGGNNTYVVYYSNGFTSTYNSSSDRIYLFEKTDGSGDDPTPVDPPVTEGTRYVETNAFVDGKDFILAVNNDDGSVTVIAARSGSSNNVSSVLLSVSTASGDDSAYINTDSTDVLWTYNASDKTLKNGSNYLYPTSSGSVMHYSSTRAISYTDGKLSFETSSSGTYYITFSNGSFGTSNSVNEAAGFRLFVIAGDDPTPVDPPTPTEGSNYKLVEGIAAGKEYLIVSSNAAGSAYALTNPGGSSNGASMGSTAVTIQSGDIDGDGAADTYISADATDIVWTAGANGSGFNLTNNGDYLEGKSGNVKIFSSQQYADRSWSYTDNQLKHTGGNNSYVVYYSNGFTSSTSGSHAVYVFEKAGSSGDDPTPVDPPVTEGTRYVETDAFVDGKDFILAVTKDDGSVYAIKAGSSSVSAATLNVTPASGEEAAYISTDDTSVVWAYTASNKYLVNGSNYLYPTSNNGIMTYSSGRAISYTDGKLSFETSSSGTYYITFSNGSFGTSNSVNEAAGFRLFVIAGDDPTPVDPPTPTEGSNYKLVEGIAAGKEYLIVSSNAAGSAYALTNPGGSSNGASMGSTAVTIQSGDIDGDGAADTYISADATDIVWTAGANGSGFNLTNNGDYLEGKSGNVKIFSSQQYADRSWSYTDNQLKHTGGNNSYVVYYSNGFTSSTSGSHAVYVFEKAGSSGDDPTPIDPPSGDGTVSHLGITSDVHGSVSRLRDWITAVQSDIDPDLEHMVYCGDYSYQMSSLDSFVAEFNQVVSATNELVGDGLGVYTSGNHEYYIGNREIPLSDSFTSVPGFVRLGEAVREDNYIVYCMGAAGWYSGNGTYPQEDIDALDEYLETAPTDIPIFIATHFPLHNNGSRTIVNADKVIDVLNDHPNTIFLWGHNHSQSDSHYGQIVKPGGSITYASGKTAEINFTYACAGGMYQDSQTQYSGLVATISATGDEVTFQYYRASTGAQIGEPTTLELEPSTPATTYTITASAGQHGSISPSGAVEVKEGRSKTFTITADPGYELDTLKVDDSVVTVSNGKYEFTNVTADHTIEATFKQAEVVTDGTIYRLVDNFVAGRDYLIVSSNATGNAYALTNPGGSSDGASMGSTGVIILSADVNDDGTIDTYISTDAADIVWNAGVNGSGFNLTNNGDYLEGKSGNVKIYNTQQYPDRPWSYSGNQLMHTGGQNSYVVYYSNGFTSSDNATSEKIYIFEQLGTADVSDLTLDKDTLSLKVGKSATLKATITPANAANTKVNWACSDTGVATVDANGKVIAVAERTATITASADADSSIKAICTLTVTESPSAGEVSHLGITSDVHGSIDDQLKNWLTAVQSDYDPDLEHVVYCGDYSYEMSSLSAYLADFNAIVEMTNDLVGDGLGIYTSGNHEYYINGEIPLNSGFTDTPGFVRIGEAVEEDNYIVYCLGAAGWFNAVGEYPEADIQTLETYLDSAPTDIPIFIAAHYPLHYNSNRTITNADKVIEVLNEHPNTIFLWGHNHSQSDSHYGQIVKPGGSITYASGKTAEINFTYACAGGMHQDSQTQYSGLVATISATGDEVTFQYYRASTGAQIGEPTTLELEPSTPATTYTITASAGQHGSISPSGAVEVKEGRNKTFTITADPGYELDTLKVDDSVVTVSNGKYEFTNVTADHTIEATFKQAEVVAYTLADSVEANGQYLIVSNGYALRNDNGTIAAVPVSVDGDLVYISKSSDNSEVYWTLKPTSGQEVSGDYTVENDGYKLSRVSGGESGGATMPSEITRDEKYSTYSGLPYFQWSYDAEDQLLTMLGGQDGDSTFYAYYNQSEHAFYTDTTENHMACYVVYKATGEDHVLVKTEAKAATCSEAGNSEYWTCTDCGKYFGDADGTIEIDENSWIIPKLDHQFGAPEWLWSSNYARVVAEFTCDVCSETESVNAVVSNETTEATCVVGSGITYTAKATFNGREYTDSKTISSGAPLGHNLTAHATVAATCETAGNSAYWSCDRCGAYFSDADGKNEINENSWVVPKLNHSWGAPQWTWTETDGDYSASAKFTCANDPTHTETVTASVSDPVDNVYTASATFNGQVYTDTKEAGFVVTIVDDTKGGAKLGNITSGETYSGNVSFTVTSDRICVAAYTTNGKDYTNLTPSIKNGVYTFDLPVEQAVTLEITYIGDVNRDGKVSNADRQILAKYITNWDGYAAKVYMPAADVNRNGKVNNSDRQILAKYISGYDPAEYNDYFVNQ